MTDQLSIVNLAVLDTVDQDQLFASDTVGNQITWVDRYLKLASLFKGHVVLSDSHLLDHIPLQRWFVENQKNDILRESSHDELPFLVISTEKPDNWEEALARKVASKMLFSSQSGHFDRLLLTTKEPTIEWFLANARPTFAHWEHLLQALEGAFPVTAFSTDKRRFVWSFGSDEYPLRMLSYIEQYGDSPVFDSKEREAVQWLRTEARQALSPNSSLAFSRSRLHRELRSKGLQGRSEVWDLANNPYREVLAAAMPSGRLLDGSYAQMSFVEKGLARSVNSLVERHEELPSRIWIDRISWETILRFRSEQEFADSLARLQAAELMESVDQVLSSVRSHCDLTLALLKKIEPSSLECKKADLRVVSLPRSMSAVGLSSSLWLTVSQMLADENVIGIAAGSVATLVLLYDFVVTERITNAKLAVGRVDKGLYQIERNVRMSLP